MRHSKTKWSQDTHEAYRVGEGVASLVLNLSYS